MSAQNIELLVVHNIPTEQPASSRESNLVSPAALQTLKLQLTDSSLLVYREKGSVFLSPGKTLHVFENIFPYQLNVKNFYFQGDSIAAVEKLKPYGVLGRTYDYLEFARASTSVFLDDTLRIAWQINPEGNPYTKPEGDFFLAITTMFIDDDILYTKNVIGLKNIKIAVSSLPKLNTRFFLYSLFMKKKGRVQTITSQNSLQKVKKECKDLIGYIFSIEFLPKPKRDFIFALESYNELLRRFPNCKDLMHMRKHYVARMKKLGFDFDF